MSAWAALFVSGKAASAEETSPKSASAPSENADIATSPPPAAALRAYEKAISAQTHGDTQGAVDAMRASYELSGRPELLYNLALLEQERQRCQASLQDYRLYIERAPKARYRDAAEQAIRELTDECPTAESEKPATRSESAATSNAEKSPTQSHAPSYWTTPRVLAWSAISAGVLSGSGALYFLFAAKAAKADVAKSVALGGMGPLQTQLVEREAAQARRDDQHWDLALAQGFGVAAAALTTGGVLTLIFSKPGAPAQSSAFISIQPGAVQASYSGTF